MVGVAAARAQADRPASGKAHPAVAAVAQHRVGGIGRRQLRDMAFNRRDNGFSKLPNDRIDPAEQRPVGLGAAAYRLVEIFAPGDVQGPQGRRTASRCGGSNSVTSVTLTSRESPSSHSQRGSPARRQAVLGIGPKLAASVPFQALDRSVEGRLRSAPTRSKWRMRHRPSATSASWGRRQTEPQDRFLRRTRRHGFPCRSQIPGN